MAGQARPLALARAAPIKLKLPRLTQRESQAAAAVTKYICLRHCLVWVVPLFNLFPFFDSVRYMSSKNLFTPVTVGAFSLPHRVVMAPLTRCRADERNAPHALNAKYYGQRATAALIISEATQVTPFGIGYPGTPGIYSDEQVAGWKLVTDAVHAKGGRIFLQLWHVGRISHPDLQPGNVLPVAPSAIAPKGQAATFSGMKPFETPRELKADEIPGVIAEFKRGAENAKSAGFDGVEVHGANGYLLDQFLRDGSNKRTDAWGGTLQKRARFPLEVLKAAISVWGPDRVGIRFSPTGTFNDMSDSNPEQTFGYMLEEVGKLNIAYVHLVDMGDADVRHGGKPIPLGYFRSKYKGTLIANGGYDLERANAAIGEGVADLISFGKPYIANPDLPERLRKQTPLNEADQSTFYGGGEKGYTDYPALSA